MNAKSVRKPVITLWTPDLGVTGGVQEYSRCIASGLAGIAQVNVVSLPDGGALSKCIFIICALKSLLRKRPDFIWCTHLHLARASFLARFFRIPVWISLHGIDCWNLTEAKDIVPLKQADRLLAVSHYTMNRVTQILPELKETLTWLPNHLSRIPEFSSHQSSARKRLHLPADALILLTVSRLSSQEQYKGHREVIRALPQLKAHYPNIFYLVVGTGDDLNNLQQLATDLNCTEHVHFTGKLSEPDLDAAYQASDLFVLAGTGEGFGIVILEALVRGIPVLASSEDGSQDAVCMGELGELVSPSETDAVYRKLHEILTTLTAELYPHSPESLRTRVIDEFGPDALKSRLQKLIRESV
jgi:glycosyltransferase involved in cell wall biosynthesis